MAWETLGAQIVYTCEGFDVVNEDAQFPDGSVAGFDYVAEGESVVVLPFTTDGDVASSTSGAIRSGTSTAAPCGQRRE